MWPRRSCLLIRLFDISISRENNSQNPGTDALSAFEHQPKAVVISFGDFANYEAPA